MTTVEKIHNEIDTAADRLLAESRQIINSVPVGKAERLAKVGFTGANLVRKANIVVKSKEMADLIEYHKQTYPFQKFLTESELERICDKYSLIFAPISTYKEDVPNKNLSDIENMPALKSNDNVLPVLQCELTLTNWAYKNDSFLSVKDELYKRLPRVIDGHYGSQYTVNDVLNEKFHTGLKYLVDRIKNVTIDRSGLFIAAPESHFNTDGLLKSKKGFFSFSFVEIKDPIVFRYVKGGIQVITKWGLEASDEALVNEIEN